MYKAFVIIMMLFIVGSLASAAFFMFKTDAGDTRMVKALTWRIGLSIALFLILTGGYYFFGVSPRAGL